MPTEKIDLQQIIEKYKNIREADISKYEVLQDLRSLQAGRAEKPTTIDVMLYEAGLETGRAESKEEVEIKEIKGIGCGLKCKCGEDIEERFIYCSYCGKKIKWVSE